MNYAILLSNEYAERSPGTYCYQAVRISGVSSTSRGRPHGTAFFIKPNSQGEQGEK